MSEDNSTGNKPDSATDALESIHDLQRQLDVLKMAQVVPFTPKKVRAQRFVLEDAEGRKTAELGADAQGFTTLAFFDKMGVNRLDVGLFGDDTPMLTMRDAEGMGRVDLACSSVGTSFFLRDVSGKRRVHLGVSPEGDSYLSLYNAQDKIAITLRIIEGVPQVAQIMPDSDSEYVFLAPEPQLADGNTPKQPGI